MMRSAFDSITTTWRSHKGMVGIVIIALVLLFIGAQVQQWIDSRERSDLQASCERRVIAVRDSFQNQATERNNVVLEVRTLSQAILKAQQDFIDTFQKRSAVTDHIAKRVDQIDKKASSAAVNSAIAKGAAQKAAATAAATQDVTVGEINRVIIDKKVRK
jgi:hypothetical protein